MANKQQNRIVSERKRLQLIEINNGNFRYSLLCFTAAAPWSDGGTCRNQQRSARIGDIQR